jgi:hypothetical protein
VQRRRHSADRPHLVAEAKPRKGSVRLRRRISPEHRLRRRSNKARHMDRRLRKVDRSVLRRRKPKEWAASVDRPNQEWVVVVATVVRRQRNIVSKATRSRLGKAIAPWVTRWLSIKCSRATRTELPPVVAARSKRRRSRLRSVLRLRKAVSVVLRLRRPVPKDQADLVAPLQGEGLPFSKPTMQITPAEARRISRRSSNHRLRRSLTQINNTAKIKPQLEVLVARRLRKVALVELRLRKAASEDLLRVSNRRRNSAEDFPPRGEGVHRRRMVDLHSLPHNNPCRECLQLLANQWWAARRRSIRIRRAASSARFSSRTKTIRREISGRCWVVA